MIRGKNVNRGFGDSAFLQNKARRAGNRKARQVGDCEMRTKRGRRQTVVSVDPDDLGLKAVSHVDQGPTKNRRRTRPAPQGRAYRERRHFCHVTVLVSR